MNKLMLNLMLMGVLLLTGAQSNAQDTLTKAAEEKYVFTVTHENPATSVKDQYRSGTCWSFGAISFFESELIRLGAGELDLSEMYYVNLAYRGKAEKYMRLHGTGNFGPGGQAHDVLNGIKKHGLVTVKEYPGIIPGETSHNHSELNSVLEGFLKGLVSSRSEKLSKAWENAYAGILDAYLGPLPKNGGQTNVKGFNPDDYIEIVSYTHHPFYSWFSLEIPDNWSQDKYFNLPLDEMMSVIFSALENGYTVCWDGDVSDKGFSHANGLAILPEKDLKSLEGSEQAKWEALTQKDKNAQLFQFNKPGKEKQITQEMRQEAFDNHASTDDHLMHVTGITTDQQGTRYLITKNSWAANSNKTGGYLNISEAYARLNTVNVMIHKNALPENIRKKLTN